MPDKKEIVMSMGLLPAGTLRSERGAGSTKVLDRFPGFNNFYENCLKPAILTGKNMFIVYMGEAGTGKETLIAMTCRKIDEDPDLIRWQQNNGIELHKFYAAWAAYINAIKTVQVEDSLGNSRPVVRPDKEMGQFSRYDIANTAYLMRRSLLDARKNNRPPTLFFVETVGVIPDDFSTEVVGIAPKSHQPVDMGFSVVRACARYPNTHFIGLVTNDKVQERSKRFRKELEKATDETIDLMLAKYRVRLDKVLRGDAIAAFRKKMGNAAAIDYMRDLVDKEIFYLSNRQDNFKKREEIMKTFNYSTPSSLEELREIFDSRNFPGRRQQILFYYLRNYLLEEILRVNSERILVGENSFLKDEDIDFYRGRLEECVLPIPTLWSPRWARIHAKP